MGAMLPSECRWSLLLLLLLVVVEFILLVKHLMFTKDRVWGWGWGWGWGWVGG